MKRLFLKAKDWSIFGRRIAKTGISVFITAFLCLILNLPPEFAVIAAIVTTEPTASASIKKGIIRLPASAIGAGLAVFFVWLWGQSSLAYTFASIFTIFICRKLKLHDGILVATLTAVAMVPQITGDYLYTFLSRLGTTFIGITVSSLINFLILPPKFMPMMEEKIKSNFYLTSVVLEQSITKVMKLKEAVKPEPCSAYLALRQSVEKVSELSSFQEREWRYHRVKLSDYRNYFKLKQINIIMQKITLHLGNLQYISESAKFTKDERQLLLDLSTSMKKILTDQCHYIPDYHYRLVNELDKQLKYENTQKVKSDQYFHHFTAKTIVYFEFLSLHDSLEELEHLMTQKFSEICS